MASHFKWYPSSEEVVVPWNARYSFPSQANKSIKLTPRIPPKNGGTFIRLEFPAQGYVNPINTTLEFDVVLAGHATATEEIVRFQNNIQTLFSRVRLLYGATPLEDIINYNTVVRCLSEWTGTNQNGIMDQCSIAEGVGGYTWANDNGATSYQGNSNVRQKYIQGICTVTPGTAAHITGGSGFGPVPQTSQPPSGATLATGTCTYRRYQVNFALGLFTQDKLIPTKFMASQLAIELTLEQAAGAIYVGGTTSVTGSPNYQVCNVNLIPEILEFDASYDAMFLKGLREGGVPIKFSSWHTYLFSSSGSSNVSLMIQERSRSVKALFTVQKRTQPAFTVDSGACFFDTSVNGASTLQSYQYRIGGRYFPASPVQCAAEVGSAVSNGGAEAFLELQKALNIVGDYRLSSSVNTARWAVGPDASGVLNEFDYSLSLKDYTTAGIPVFVTVEDVTNCFSGTLGSAAFAMAIDLETSNGVEISGLNAEEQSDIALLATWKAGQNTGASGTPSSLEVYTYYDAMIVLRENNVLELIQ
jgi:hypothetical protein